MHVTTACSVTNARIRISPPRGTHRRWVRADGHVDFEHQPQQLRPASTPRPERRPRSHLALRVIVRLFMPRAHQHHAAPSPPAASPARVRSVVAHPHLALARDVLHQPRHERHRRHPVHPGVRTVDRVRGELHLGVLGVVAQSRLGHRRTRPVARHAQHRGAILRGDSSSHVRAEPRVRPRQHRGCSILLEPVLAHEQRQHGAPPQLRGVQHRAAL